MKTLKNKIFAGALALASLGFFGEKNLMAQDTLYKITIKYLEDSILVSGYGNDESRIVFIGCFDNDGDEGYNKRLVYKKNLNIFEDFYINFNTGLINYESSFWSKKDKKRIEIANFKNLTKEQIYQDKEFAERTKRIINACENDEKLREMIKEIYKERGVIKIPQIKQ